MHGQSCRFANLNLLLFRRCRCLNSQIVSQMYFRANYIETQIKCIFSTWVVIDLLINNYKADLPFPSILEIKN